MTAALFGQGSRAQGQAGRRREGDFFHSRVSQAAKKTERWQVGPDLDVALSSMPCVLPCWDESDDGVLPCCVGPAPVPWWAVFNHDHAWLNHTAACYAWGNIGYRFCGERRKYVMGLVMWSTLLTIGGRCRSVVGVGRRSAVRRRRIDSYPCSRVVLCRGSACVLDHRLPFASTLSTFTDER